jgi:pimeloyl-ACP methyl ester carboxylesterase
LQLSLSAGEAVARWLKHRHPEHTAKLVAKDAGLDPRTVENILEGHLSGPTYTKLLRAYRFPLGMTVLAAVLGETYEDCITRELEDIAHDRRELDASEAHLRNSYARLRARRSVDPGGLRLVSPPSRDPLSDERRAG